MNDPHGTISEKRFPWVAVSLLLHLVAAVLLYHFTPLHEIVLDEKKDVLAPSPVSEKRVNEVQQQLDERIEDRLRTKVAHLRDIGRSMQAAVDYKNKAYRVMASEEAADALEQAHQQMEEAMEEQKNAMADQTLHEARMRESLKEVDAFLARWSEVSGKEEQK